jgi:hypothetical protein
MNNHWHILAQTPLGNLGEFMRHFNITYTSHYNRRHNRSGHLYQGRYQSFLVELDSYLSQVSRYIHLNPVKTVGMKRMAIEKQLDHLWKYSWSSLPGYANMVKRLDFVHYATVLAEHGGDTPAGRRSYKKQIVEDLTDGLPIKMQIVGQSILGGESFVTWVRENFLKIKKDREIPGVGKIQRYLSKEAVLAVIEEETGFNNLIGSTGIARQIVMTALYKYAGLNNREIGNLLDVDYSTISQGRKRLREKAENDKDIEMLINSIERAMSKIKI